MPVIAVSAVLEYDPDAFRSFRAPGRTATGMRHAGARIRQSFIPELQTGRGIVDATPGQDQGSKTVEPVVFRDSRSRCACAASRKG